VALERTEDERQLALAMARLSPEHREVLLLKDIDGLKYEDIAELLGVPIGTIRSRLHRARLELRELLVPEEERRGGEGGAGAPPVETENADRREGATGAEDHRPDARRLRRAD
jgi:RNA polymerase sigma-70 factor (ECF subfamily)